MEVLSQNFTNRSCAFKGKRTKRSRLSSPQEITGMTAVTTTIISSTAGGSDYDDSDRGGGGFSNSTTQYSPTTCTTQISTSYSTSEEDEDMANCLILLAQSGCGQKVQVVAELKKEKIISSKKFAEMTTSSTTGKAVFVVYECKTCNRTFPSFQALGGHRASHKKSKTIVEEQKSVTVSVTTAAAHDHHHQHLHQEENDQEQGRLNKISVPFSNQILVNNNNNNNINKTKIHECSICGSEFSSGQALGGHMRRHRPPTTTTSATTNTKITTSCNVSDSSSSYHDEKSTRNLLSLDLNLPAQPEEDDHKFEQSLVFSATPLVDCYYL